MLRIERTSEASRDLVAIAWHIAQDNPTAASNWLNEVEQLFTLIAEQPQMGERMRTRRFGLVRRISRGNYVTYYRKRSEAIEILRVLHGAREQKPLL
jgi:toxin ParE1/3/4